MTDLAPIATLVVPAMPLVGVVFALLARTPRQADRLNIASALTCAAVALAFAVAVLLRGGEAPLHGRVYLIDGASGVFIAIIAIVGLCSALTSPAYLRTSGRSWFGATHSRRWYYVVFNIFWAALLAVPVVGNLGLSWLIVETTTATSALLVAFSGRRNALEAGWKYLVLTTLGLSVALLGIIVLAIGQANAGQHGIHALDWHTLAAAASSLPHEATLFAFVLILAGLATKIGWAPVHNWLPDAHSEAPAPISALLSAALLPTVLLVAWRVKSTLGEAVGPDNAAAIFIGFGLASVIVAVPFLWRSLPWKRLLAYSSLEHMGIIALGIGFGSSLAIAGVVLHVAGHALAKSLGFYAALPLLRADPKAAEGAAYGLADKSPPTAVAMGVSLATLAGLPPSPLFVSELLVLLGGITAGYTVVTAITVVALALGFLGLLHAFMEGVVGDGPPNGKKFRRRPERATVALTAVLGAGLVTLTALGVWLPDSNFITTLTEGAL